jgi:hypothetical protein
MADEKIDYFDGIRDHFSQLDTQINAHHILSFKTKADTNVIADVATKIMGTGNEDIEDYKKN